MDIYDWMRLVSSKLPVSEPVQADALALVDDLERVSALGTMAARTDGQAHRCSYPPMSSVCSYCQRERDV